MIDMIKDILSHLGRPLTRKTQQMLHDQTSLIQLSRYMDAYLPWTTSSIRPSGLAMIMNELIVHNKSSILEVGCGISSIILSKYLSSENGGEIVSIENDPAWIGVVDKLTNQETSRIIQADIRPCTLGKSDYRWYDVDQVYGDLQGKQFDVLLVDAPLQSLCANSRYPALPLLRQFLKEDFVLFLDDIDRKDEGYIASSWAREFGLTYKKQSTNGGVGILRPNTTKCHLNIC